MGRQMVAQPIRPQALTLKMRGRSLDGAWITSEARTGVAENWGSLGGSWSRSGVTLPLAALLTHSSLVPCHCLAPTSDPAPAGGPHWLG